MTLQLNDPFHPICKIYTYVELIVGNFLPIRFTMKVVVVGLYDNVVRENYNT